MTNEPSSKRVKLSLEPSIINDVMDITNTGQKILKTDIALPEKLMQTVDRVWFERGDWKDITEASLEASMKKQQEDSTDEKDEKKDTELASKDESQLAAAAPPGLDVMKLRESVINKLFYAKSEIDVALDIINILAAGNRSSVASTKDLVLPNGSLNATYVTKPKPTQKAQLEHVQLNLGLKRKQQKQASEFLKSSAANLGNLVEKEQVFWNEALDLRRNIWPMQANTNASGGVSSGSSFFIQYGFSEVGSDFSESSLGELKRADEAAEDTSNLQLSLPHSMSRKVSVCVSQSHMGHLSLRQDTSSEGILGITTQSKCASKNAVATPKNTAYTTHQQPQSSIHSRIQKQLAEAQSTVFDAELFSDVLSEVQTLSSNVRFEDDEVVISIDGQLDLSISKSPYLDDTKKEEMVDEEEEISTTQQIMSRTIDLSLRLLLIQRHRYNLWKVRARALSSNHKIHQLLIQNDPLLNPSASAAAVPNPTNSASGSTVSTPTASGGPASNNSNANAAAAAANAMRSRSRLLQSSTAVELPKEIPILSPILNFTRFWVQFDRIRHVVNSLVTPFCKYGGVPLSVHFKVSDALKQNKPKSAYDAYPAYGELALSLGITIQKSVSLHFSLNQAGSISVCLPQTIVVLHNIAEFEAFLSREINVFCLRNVCEVANDIIRMTKVFNSASGSDKRKFLWKVDEVDEAIHGSVCWFTSQEDYVWRNINIRVKVVDDITPSYSLQFHLSEVNKPTKLPAEIRQVQLSMSNADRLALNFEERVRIVIRNIIIDAMPVQ